jgi:hypothetical protein
MTTSVQHGLLRGERQDSEAIQKDERIKLVAAAFCSNHVVLFSLAAVGMVAVEPELVGE